MKKSQLYFDGKKRARIYKYFGDGKKYTFSFPILFEKK